MVHIDNIRQICESLNCFGLTLNRPIFLS